MPRKKRYLLFLTGGKSKIVTARTPKQAKYKYYASAEHFRTEDNVVSIETAPPKRRRKKSYWGF